MTWYTSNVNSFNRLFSIFDANSFRRTSISDAIDADLAGIGAWDTSRVTDSRFGASVESYIRPQSRENATLTQRPRSHTPVPVAALLSARAGQWRSCLA